MHALYYLLPLLPLTLANPSNPKARHVTNLNPHTARHLVRSPRVDEAMAATAMLARDGTNSDSHQKRKVSVKGHTGQRMIRRRKRASCVVPPTPSSSSFAAKLAAPVPSTSPRTNSSTSLSVQDVQTSSSITSSTPASTPSTNSTTPSGNTGKMGAVMPLSTKDYWTTSTDSGNAMSFNDALNPLFAGKMPSSTTAPDGSTALVATYPAGIYGLSGSGFNFYTEGIHSNVDVTSANEVLLSYSVFFEDGFDFNKGGKMPGFFGGTSLDSAKTCSGGRQDGRSECFSARLMFRTNGMGEFYNYFPTSATQPTGYCSTPPMSTCNPDYGDSIGRGSFNWTPGQWVTVAQRLKMNDVGQKNGEQELFVNGKSVLSLSNLEIAVEEGTKVYGIMAQTFFGGSGSDWASPKDQSAYFKDWTLAVLS
ncbi:hypothetical protein M231_04777 [Tremella mesenterica]|uniref:Polysaccharide lyase 14 domain-containing protein n=1 Tax=Tremella mesenterica TaxID=5217 RepID=A0A4Q1BJS5_TREME|nr:hypothetical protein M231_04777 [Tremella mesenterica]